MPQGWMSFLTIRVKSCSGLHTIAACSPCSSMLRVRVSRQGVGTRRRAFGIRNAVKSCKRFAHDGDVAAVQFNTKGTRLATGSMDKTARLGIRKAVKSCKRFAHDGAVLAVQFNAKGTRLATASRDKTARIWRTDRKELIDTLCSRLSRNLTCIEWGQYLYGETYRPTCSGLSGPRHCPIASSELWFSRLGHLSPWSCSPSPLEKKKCGN